MPEELVIALAILVGAIWLLVKIWQGIVGAFYQAQKNRTEAGARRKQIRYLEVQNKLRPYVHSQIPDELDPAEKKFEAALTKFELTKKIRHWVAHPPAWRREEFRPLAPPHKSNDYGEMSIDDIDAILSQNSDASTWSAKESEITSRKCTYPSAPPSRNFDKFTEFPKFCANLKTAVSEIDGAHISDEGIVQYFSHEQTGVLTYNKRRAELSVKIASLNSAIEAWNKQNRMTWEAYVAESEKMKEKELLAFQSTSELYLKACREETSHFKR